MDGCVRLAKKTGRIFFLGLYIPTFGINTKKGMDKQWEKNYLQRILH